MSDYTEEKPHRVKRILWRVVNVTLFRLFAGSVLWPVRKLLLEAFGAKIGKQAIIYAKCDIYAPWNLSVGRVCIGPQTKIYNKAMIKIGDDSVISQGGFLCTASHDISRLIRPLVTDPITIGDNVWVAADAFVGPGVIIGDGAVVGARAAVFKNVDPWTVVGGNPAVVLKKRVVVDGDSWDNFKKNI